MRSAAGALRVWPAALAGERLRAQWRLLIAVTTVAVVACTLVASLAVLVTATEEGGVRTALDALPVDDTAVTLALTDLTVSPAEAQDHASTAVAELLGTAATLPAPISAAWGDFVTPETATDDGRIAYLGELSDPDAHATLTAGTWPTAADDAAIPAAAATALGIALGDRITIPSSTVTVVGLFETDESEFWARDPLIGSGFEATFPLPKVTFFVPVPAFGPILVASVPAPVVGVTAVYSPDFSTATVSELGPLLVRLRDAPATISAAVGTDAADLNFSSELRSSVQRITSGLVVTRSTVIVVGLLLIVLAAVAMAQTARLLTDSRTGEQRLMVARGASRRSLLAVGVVEALVIGGLTAAVSPPLAALVFDAIAATPVMRAAGIASASGVPGLAWSVSVAVAVLFGTVLVVPAIRAARTTVASAGGRQRAGAAFMRSGLDVGILVLAAVAYWQLRTYRGVFDATESLTIDPVLAVGPALVLVAGALLSVRLVPIVAHLAERVPALTPRAVLALAAWETSRRAQRAIAAVLLLSIAVAVGTFGLSFLATWRQSQLDQAGLAIGAAVRVEAGPSYAQLADGATTAPQAAFRRPGLLPLSSVESNAIGTPVTVLGLSAQTRDAVTTGPTGDAGGRELARLLDRDPIIVDGVSLPAGAGELRLSALGSTAVAGGARAALRAIIDTGHGTLTTLSLGTLPVDGAQHELSARLPASAQGLEFVGLQADLTAGEGDDATTATIAIGALTADGSAVSGSPEEWFSGRVLDASSATRVTAPPAGWLLAVRSPVVPGEMSTLAVVAWRPTPYVLAVVPQQLADEFEINPGTQLPLLVQRSTVTVSVIGAVRAMPGSADARDLDAMSLGLGSASVADTTIVVDQSAIARALAQQGVPGELADEWWVDVSSSSADAYIAGLPNATAYSRDRLGAQLQTGALRIGTPAALWLVVVASALLAAIGFIAHSAATLRARRLELAQLRAIGLTRRGLLALVAAESALLSVLSIVFGVGVGVALAFLVGPLVTVSPDGQAPVPAVEVVLPVGQIALLAVEVAIVLALVVVVTARLQRLTRPADLLREGMGQ